MRKAMLAVFLMACSMSVAVAQSKNEEIAKPNAAPAEKKELGPWDGFRGIEWGTKIDQLKGMNKLEAASKGKIEAYVRDGDSKKIGEVETSLISYMFYKGEFCGVVISAKGEDSARHLKATLEERYGEATQPNQFIEDYMWTHSPFTTWGVIITLKYNMFSKEVTVVYLFQPIWSEQEKDAKEQAKAAAKSDL